MYYDYNHFKNKLYYQTSGDRANNFGNKELFIHTINNKKEAINSNDVIYNRLKIADNILTDFYNYNINKTSLINLPFESDIDKYNRLFAIDSIISQRFLKLKDSLFFDINKLIYDSIRVVSYNSNYVFNILNYDETDQFWRILLKNPFNNEYYSFNYQQSLNDAKISFKNKYTNISISVTYCYNLMSKNYEPLLATLKNSINNDKTILILPYKSILLAKNMHFIDNTVLDYYFNDDYYNNNFITNVLGGIETGILSHDSDILKYFISIGKPKFYFDYGLNKTNRGSDFSIKIKNLNDTSVNFTIADNYYTTTKHFYYIDKIPYYYNIFNEYHIKYPNLKDFKSQKFIFNNQVSSIENRIDNYIYTNNSPNLIYTISNNELININKNKILFKLNESKNVIFWDCNSHYISVGYDNYPIPILDMLLK